ncbi:MAG: hypothetical protein K9J16_00005 [Melioribacteraceae bacterium]|nr:hypothetical protein [Melioribacteraceae bacterium]MCF8353892.1 hypothetical protein [Melioribacteraceae bacterium]MCF8392648.1 hypothetical protein [Melioribacteraceae bacterium]MCF8417669.1 hypothetical protein [Melioribacteraceae bacterium]
MALQISDISQLTSDTKFRELYSLGLIDEIALRNLKIRFRTPYPVNKNKELRVVVRKIKMH